MLKIKGDDNAKAHMSCEDLILVFSSSGFASILLALMI